MLIDLDINNMHLAEESSPEIIDKLASQIPELWDELQSKSGESIELEKLMKTVEGLFSIGDIVEIINTDYTGKIVKFRTRLGGFYPAVRYPLDVEIISCTSERFRSNVGSTFEYSIDFIYHKELLEKAFDDYCNEIIDGRLRDDPRYMRCIEYWKMVDKSL